MLAVFYSSGNVECKWHHSSIFAVERQMLSSTGVKRRQTTSFDSTRQTWSFSTNFVEVVENWQFLKNFDDFSTILKILKIFKKFLDDIWHLNDVDQRQSSSNDVD